MIVKKLGFAIGLASLAGSAAYFFIYLSRWEWNRALISGMLLLIVEVMMLGGILMTRLGRLERSVSGATITQPNGTGATLAHLHRTRPAPHRPFAWLDPTKSRGTNVFVPVLMGAGVVVSALAWLVERIARSVARPGMEEGLANSLDVIAYPTALLAVDDHVPPAVALLEGPIGRR